MSRIAALATFIAACVLAASPASADPTPGTDGPVLATRTGFLVDSDRAGHTPTDLSALLSPASSDATANCGTNLYVKKCEHCFLMYGLKTDEECQETAGLIEHNREVLERALCRLSEFEGWKQEADEKSQEALGDLIEQVAENLPGIGNPVNLRTIAGKATFVGRVADLMQMQIAVVEFLGNSQGSSFFTGMIRPVKREVNTVTKELTKELAWFEKNCPPPDMDPEPLPLLPPDYIVSDADDKPDKPAETPTDTVTLDEHEDELFDQNALRWQVDFAADPLSVPTWSVVLGDIPALGLVGFIRGMNRGAYAGRLHPVNLTHARQALDEAFRSMPRGSEARFLREDFFEVFEDDFTDRLETMEPQLSTTRMGAGSADQDTPEHASVRLMPGSTVRNAIRYDTDSEERMTAGDGETTVSGNRWFAEYEIRDASGAVDERKEPAHILTEYELEAERLGGEVLLRTQNRLEYRIPAPRGGGSTWVKVWASKGIYSLIVVDE